MRLYHFINEEYGLEDLREKRLKVARIMELNDLFEFMGVDLSDRALRNVMETIKKDIAKDSGILCFSQGWDNTLLWSHYADGHKGLCLGFDIPDDKSLVKVNYVDKRLSVDEFKDGVKVADEKYGEKFDKIDPSASLDEFARQCPELDENDLLFVRKIIATKFSQWSYEKEYRLFVSLEIKESDGLYYAPFSKDINLMEVIVGLRSCVNRKHIEDALGAMAGSVEVFKVRADDRVFAVVRDEKSTF